MQPQFPIYIPSKGRWDNQKTMRSLDAMGCEYLVIVEEQEHDKYAAAIGEDKLLILDMRYKEQYNTCDNFGLTKSTGAGPARNFAWDHAVARGAEWHWIIDDNINGFYRAHKNRQIRITDGTGLRVMEDFCLRYENLVLAGPQYFMFLPRKLKVPPVVFNTRIYSCQLIRNDIPFRWHGRYNEDTLLSIAVLKAKLCTAQFNIVLQHKTPTMMMKGGNVDEFYTNQDRYVNTDMLVDQHPDIARHLRRFGRNHHWVDYRRFRQNKLIKKEGIEIQKGPNNYGWKLKTIDIGEATERRRPKLKKAAD